VCSIAASLALPSKGTRALNRLLPADAIAYSEPDSLGGGCSGRKHLTQRVSASPRVLRRLRTPTLFFGPWFEVRWTRLGSRGWVAFVLDCYRLV
jgi:hypothetical protein